jgi:hypothetical protein
LNACSATLARRSGKVPVAGLSRAALGGGRSTFRSHGKGADETLRISASAAEPSDSPSNFQQQTCHPSILISGPCQSRRRGAGNRTLAHTLSTYSNLVHPAYAATARVDVTLGSSPSSTSRHAATVPLRPRPPRQDSRTLRPSRRRPRPFSPTSRHRASNALSGTPPSAIGAWRHGMPLASASRRRSASRADGTHPVPGHGVIPILPPLERTSTNSMR